MKTQTMESVFVFVYMYILPCFVFPATSPVSVAAVQPQQDDGSSTQVPSIPFRSDRQQKMVLEEKITSLNESLAKAEQQLKAEREYAQRRVDATEKENIKLLQEIQRLEKLVRTLQQELKDKQRMIVSLLDTDEYDNVYSFFESKSSFVVDRNCCIICDKAPPKEKVLECQRCHRPENEHGNLQHEFIKMYNCKSHLYPKCVLEVVCKSNNSWIYDAIDHKSCTPGSCKRTLICSLCEPVTSKLERGFKERFTTQPHDQLHPDDTILFSVLAYRSMLFNLHHYRNECCIRHRLNVKSILQYGWKYNHSLRFSETCVTTPPALLYLQSPEDRLPSTLHFPTVCELDFTATNPARPPELGDHVLVIYGCIPPYHYVLLRDPEAERHLQLYCQQIVTSINKRLSEELNTYYENENEARKWLEQKRHHEKDEHWLPVLTFGHLSMKCCLKIQVE